MRKLYCPAGEVERIDPLRREVVVSGNALQAEHLVVALGAEFAPDAVPGLAECGHTFCTLDGAVRLQEALSRFQGGRIVVLTAAPAYKCPAAPYEAAMLIDAETRRRGIRGSVALSLYSAEPGPMGVAGPEVSAAVRGLVEQKGIAYFPSHQVARVAGGQVEFTNGVRAGYDLLVYVPPIRPPRVIAESGLADGSGWVPVDRATMETRFPGVYAIGDVTSVGTAKAGVFAEGAAQVVAAALIAEQKGGEGPAAYKGAGTCYVEFGHGFQTFRGGP